MTKTCNHRFDMGGFDQDVECDQEYGHEGKHLGNVHLLGTTIRSHWKTGQEDAYTVDYDNVED